MKFNEKIKLAWEKSNSLLCVGLDSDSEKLPAHLKKTPNALFDFNRALIDATHDLVCAYKLQFAFYGSIGAEAELEKTIAYLRQKYSEIPIILDSKRGDIGNTACAYVKESFDRYGADAVTVNPYLGFDSLKPFLERSDKGTIILCRTSNPGARDFQDLRVDGKPLYRLVAEKAAKDWNNAGNVSLVVGATYPAELKEIREIVGDLPLLVPGIGAQGGDVEAAVRNGIDSAKTGMIINNSRQIIFASSGEDFAAAARKAAISSRDLINQYR